MSWAYSFSVKWTNPGGGCRFWGGGGWFVSAASFWFFGGSLGGSFWPPGVGELVELNLGARRAAAGAVCARRATRNAGLVNGVNDSLEQRASWRAEVRNMVAVVGG